MSASAPNSLNIIAVIFFFRGMWDVKCSMKSYKQPGTDRRNDNQVLAALTDPAEVVEKALVTFAAFMKAIPCCVWHWLPNLTAPMRQLT